MSTTDQEWQSMWLCHEQESFNQTQVCHAARPPPRRSDVVEIECNRRPEQPPKRKSRFARPVPQGFTDNT